MKPYYQDDLVTIFHADCREVLSSIRGVSAVLTDPPYGLGFMGKGWDKQGVSFQPGIWRLIRKACLPGAMLLSFGGTRTSHRIACAIEDAGWQIRDTIMWVYGSGFPKSLDISKAIDKRKGAKREIVGYRETSSYPDSDGIAIYKNRSKSEGTQVSTGGQPPITAPTTPEAKLWEGYGTALKPAYEPIILAMKPIDGTFANNALKHGVAGLNIDRCRIAYKSDKDRSGWSKAGTNGSKGYMGTDTFKMRPVSAEEIQERCVSKGRFPANFIHDGSQEVMELFPETKSGVFKKRKTSGIWDDTQINQDFNGVSGDSGSAARFFYTAKASRRERDAGLEDMPLVGGKANAITVRGNTNPTCQECGGRKINIGDGKVCCCEYPQWRAINNPVRNTHPTVKPLSLMTYLCKLVRMPEYNLILDPFCGSGSALLACKQLGIPCIGIDSSEEYCEISAKRVYSFNG